MMKKTLLEGLPRLGLDFLWESYGDWDWYSVVFEYCVEYFAVVFFCYSVVYYPVFETVSSFI